MTNILVPTDFTPASLKLAENAMNSGNYEKCNLVLFHAFDLTTSPYDLLGNRHIDPSCELMNEAFRQACKQLKDDYGKKINKIVVRSMLGNTRAVFRNFVEANDIDIIYCPENYQFRPVHARSIDPCYLFRKAAVPVIKSLVRKTEKAFETSYFNNMQMSTQ
jgi:hypothetical protein